MSKRSGIAAKSGITTGTAAKTLIQVIAAPNHAIDITEVDISFHGVNSAHEPITVELLRQTDAGTMSALTIVKADDSVADTFDTTAQHTATAEPTASDILRVWAVHPQLGKPYPVFDEAPLKIGAGDRVGLRVTAANSVTCDCYLCFNE